MVTGFSAELDRALTAHQSGMLARAWKIYGRLRKRYSNQVDVLHYGGLCAHQMGKRSVALSWLYEALALQPDNPDLCYNLGNVERAAGHLDKAVAHYRKTVGLRPHDAVAWNNLGSALAHGGRGAAAGNLARLEEALACYHEALSIRPDYADAHNNLGNALQEMGRLEDADTSYRRALAIRPDYAEAHSNLGNALQEMGRPEDAVVSYRKALAIRPDYAEAHSNLGIVLQELGHIEDAVASYRQALAIKPDFAEVYSNLGTALKELERLDDALASYHKALAIKPDFVEAHGNLAELLEKTNRTDALREAVAEGKRNCPGHPRLSLGEAQLLKREGNFAAARAVLEDAGEATGIARFLASRGYLLGDLCDRLGDTEAAFNYFKEGNLRSRDTPAAKRFDGQRYLTRVNVLTKRFTPEWVAGWRQLESPDDRAAPVFLVGFQRSGTTLIDTILRSHAAIAVIEEKPTISKVRAALERFPGGEPDGLAALDAAQLAELRQVYFTELDKHLDAESGASIVIDKMPMNTVNAGLIHRIFPQARFLFAERHPCDCVLSCFMQNFEHNAANANFLDLEDAARLYDKVMTVWQRYQTVLPLAVHTVRYETLIDGFEETLAPVLDFLGVGWDDGMRHYAETARRRRKINTASYSQVTQPLYTRARGRWEGYREQMRPVLPLLLPWARRFGYGD